MGCFFFFLFIEKVQTCLQQNHRPILSRTVFSKLQIMAVYSCNVSVLTTMRAFLRFDDETMSGYYVFDSTKRCRGDPRTASVVEGDGGAAGLADEVSTSILFVDHISSPSLRAASALQGVGTHDCKPLLDGSRKRRYP